MLWPIIRIFVSAIVIFETALAGLFNGILMKPIDMPEPVTGEYSQYVDPFIGTGGTPWTCGMLSPAATVPFGTVRLGPDTSFMGGTYITKMNTSGYYYEQRHITGFSHSRLSGTGAEDYGIFRVTPVTGKKKVGVIPYSHNNEVAAPGYYAVYLQTMNCLAEMTADTHTGVHRYTFDNSKDSRLYIDVTSVAAGRSADSGFVNFDEETGMITGGAVIYGAFSSRYDGLPVYFAATADKEIKSYEITGDSKDLGIDLNFGKTEGDSIELKLAVSFVSVENAKLNLAAETDGLDFDAVRDNAVADWEERLAAISIDSNDEIKTIFYTALYHSMIMPTDFTDTNGEYLGFDKQVHTADGYTYRSDMSLWDTCRNTHSLYTLIAHDVQYDCLNSLVEMAKAGGSLPRWPQGAGYSGSMQGDTANIVITESYLKGFTDFDVETAYEYMKKSSDSKVKRSGRDWIDEYNRYGYVPNDIAKADESVSKTIEYSWQDNAIAVLAEALGKQSDAEKYAEKALYYKNVFNPETKYFQARNSDGSFTDHFSPYITSFYDAVMIEKYADCYCEGSARQWRWSATHDIEGMIELFGSEEYFVSELEDFMEDASLNRAAVDPGHGYWVGNQHDIHTPYLFANAGRADLTQKWVRWTLDNRFSTDVNGLDGNDDGGTLSSWYVFSAIGFYPLAGTDKYWLGSPNVDSAELALGNGSTLSITAVNQGEKNIYVEKITLNGKELDGCYVTHEELMGGGELVFTMSPTA
ncbi:MAG: GH92 family glycosyl hydrolase [Clostridia bacterium]|nr:GH92 family glycosyl hydrolase [Clostridia bacterium]